jgi:hypothetical protein
MAQVSQITLDNVTFAQFRSDLNDSLNALNSNHVGSSQPASATEGMIWIDSSVAGTLTMKMVDADGDDQTLFSINTSTNAVTLPSSVSISEADPSAIPFAIALG